MRRDAYVSRYSVQMRENAGEMRTRITPNMNTFYAMRKVLSTTHSLAFLYQYLWSKPLAVSQLLNLEKKQ